jgi:hypothetical protein
MPMDLGLARDHAARHVRRAELHVTEAERLAGKTRYTFDRSPKCERD